MDITSLVTLPVWIMEPYTILQKVAEIMEYTDALDRAAATEDPYERSASTSAVVTVCVSGQVAGHDPQQSSISWSLQGHACRGALMCGEPGHDGHLWKCAGWPGWRAFASGHSAAMSAHGSPSTPSWERPSSSTSPRTASVSLQSRCNPPLLVCTLVCTKNYSLQHIHLASCQQSATVVRASSLLPCCR